MIIINGCISYKIKAGDGLGENGNPIPPEMDSVSEPIPCHIRQLKYNNLAKSKEGNNFVIASYEVLIEKQNFPYENVKLTMKNGKELGEFSIISTQDLFAVNATQILV